MFICRYMPCYAVVKTTRAYIRDKFYRAIDIHSNIKSLQQKLFYEIYRC